MWESDDRLAGDLVWELFQPAQETQPGPPWTRWAVAGAIAGLGLWFYPPIAVVTVCLAVAWGDFARGFQPHRSIPDPWAARLSARFSSGWGLWKVGITAFGLMFATIMFVGRRGELPSASATAILLWMLGFTASALVTASGLIVAIRNGMRVWIGEGVNQAGTLLLTMLIVGFTAGILMPLCIVLAAHFPATAADASTEVPYPLFVMFGCMFAGPVVLLVILDAVGKRVIADRPTKFGPKVAAFGKWTKPDAGRGPLILA
jgi:hypothetical protein